MTFSIVLTKRYNDIIKIKDYRYILSVFFNDFRDMLELNYITVGISQTRKLHIVVV